MTKKVTFKLAAKYVNGAKGGIIVGSFNNWDTNQGIPMVPQSDGSMKVDISLAPGEAYEYRYLLSDGRWVNDDGPKKMVEAFGYKIENCVLAIPGEKKKAAPSKESKPKKEKSVEKPAAAKKSAKPEIANFTKIAGINKKIDVALKAEQVTTFEALGKCTMKQLMLILENASLNNKLQHLPSWTKQAKLAAAGKWDELKEMQQQLKA